MEFVRKRFNMLVAKDLKENKKTYLMYVGTLLAVNVIVALLWSLITLREYNIYGKEYSELFFLRGELASLKAILFCISIVFMCVAISTTFNLLNRKDKRLNYLLLPASLTEKFCSRLMVTVFWAFVVLISVVLLTDVFSIVLQLLFFGEYHSIVITSFEEIQLSELFYIVIYNAQGESTVLSPLIPYLLFNYTLFLLGSALFRKNAFVKMLIVFSLLYAVILVFANIFTPFSAWLSFSRESVNYGFIFFFLVGSVFNVWYSHRLFCKTYVTGYKLLG